MTVWEIGTYESKARAHNLDAVEIIAKDRAEAQAVLRDHGFKGLQDKVPMKGNKRYLRPGQKAPKPQIRVRRHKNSNWYHPPTLAELAMDKSKREYISTPIGDRKFIDIDWEK